MGFFVRNNLYLCQFNSKCRSFRHETSIQANRMAWWFGDFGCYV